MRRTLRREAGLGIARVPADLDGPGRAVAGTSYYSVERTM
jgi:hypothetical protein